MAKKYLLSSCSKKPQTQRVVAVLPVDINVGQPSAYEDWQHNWLINHGNPVREAVNTGLVNNRENLNIRIVDTNHIDRIVEQHKFEASEWSDTSKVAEIGRALNADCIVITTVTHNGKVSESDMFEWRIFVTVSVLDINTMELLTKTDATLKTNMVNVILLESKDISLKPVGRSIKRLKFR